jgi:toxin ParE1/3/4
LAATRWIARDSPSAARGLRAAVSEAGRSIGEHPLVGSRRPELTSAPVRFLPLKRFPYLLAYDPERTPPLILRIVHASRDLPVALAELNDSAN